jgi:hypothetical protein
MLADAENDAETQSLMCQGGGWTHFQLADRLLRGALGERHAAWADLVDPWRRAEARRQFNKYAYQWY